MILLFLTFVTIPNVTDILIWLLNLKNSTRSAIFAEPNCSRLEAVVFVTMLVFLAKNSLHKLLKSSSPNSIFFFSLFSFLSFFFLILSFSLFLFLFLYIFFSFLFFSFFFFSFFFFLFLFFFVYFFFFYLLSFIFFSI
jgi:hypothetical protein